MDSELDFDESAATMLGAEGGVTALEEEPELSESGISSGDLGMAGLGSLPPTTAVAPAPAMAAMTAANDMAFTVWNILLLVSLLICLVLCGTMLFDLNAKHVELERHLLREQLADGYDFELV